MTNGYNYLVLRLVTAIYTVVTVNSQIFANSEPLVTANFQRFAENKWPNRRERCDIRSQRKK